MIEIEIPKDVRQYESKLVGPFTTRQTVCLVIGAGLAFAFYKLFPGLPSDIRIFASGIIAAPVLLFGWLKIYGMKLEDFLRAALISSFISPKHRLYKTQNIYTDNTKKLSKKELDKKRNSMPKSKTYIAFK